MTTLQEEYGEAITRCVCGDDSDESGFMIQCDTEGCRVWQHADCVGLTQETVPDKYYCEKCQPDHQVHVARRQLLAQTPRKVKGRGGKTKPISHKKKGLIKPNNKRKKPRSLHEDDFDLVPPPSPSPAPPVNVMKRLRTRAPSDALPSPVSRTTSSRPSREDRELQKQLEKFSKMESSLLRPNSIPAQLPSPPPLPPPTIQKGKKIRVVGRKTDIKETPTDPSTARGARARVRAQAKAQTKPRGKLSKSTKNNNRPRPSRPPSPGKSAKVSLEELAWERRKERPLAPMYLGKKQWLLRDYRHQQERTHCDYHRRYMDAKIPIKKRILLNYLTGKGTGTGPKSDNLTPVTEPPRLTSTNKTVDLSVKPRAKIPRKNSLDSSLPPKKPVSQKSSGDKTNFTVTTRSGTANSRQQKTVIKNNSKIPSKGSNTSKRQKGLSNHIQPSSKSGNSFNLPSRSDLTVRSNFVSNLSPLAPNSNPTTTVK